MREKYELHVNINTVLKKYCNGDFGFDCVVARDGTFQYALLKLMSLLAQDVNVYFYFLKSSSIDFLS